MLFEIPISLLGSYPVMYVKPEICKATNRLPAHIFSLDSYVSHNTGKVKLFEIPVSHMWTDF